MQKSENPLIKVVAGAETLLSVNSLQSTSGREILILEELFFIGSDEGTGGEDKQLLNLQIQRICVITF